VPGQVTVWARVALPGFHYWPGAPPHRSYLSARHRHLFIVAVAVAVDHDDRDTEFHDLADLIREWWGPPGRDWGASSCETLARGLAATLDDAGAAVVSVEVSEDGESGATYTPGGADV
jgi:hypothetical protein